MTAEEKTISGIKLFLFDMDGTLYLGNRLYPFTIELLRTIRATGSNYLFVTNNSSKSVQDYVNILGRLGIGAVEDDFFTSSQATAYYLKKHYSGARLYVGGTNSLKEELRKNGFTVTENTDETDVIVMGFDTELNFRKLDDISMMLTTRDIPYIATNLDYVCPTAYGYVPDCGSVCDMLYNATNKRPLVIGKPQALMPKLAMEKTGCTPDRTAVVGDRIYTDIKCGLNAGCVTILVMTGETTPEILEASVDKPQFCMESAAGILEILRKKL